MYKHWFGTPKLEYEISHGESVREIRDKASDDEIITAGSLAG